MPPRKEPNPVLAAWLDAPGLSFKSTSKHDEPAPQQQQERQEQHKQHAEANGIDNSTSVSAHAGDAMQHGGGEAGRVVADTRPSPSHAAPSASAHAAPSASAHAASASSQPPSAFATSHQQPPPPEAGSSQQERAQSQSQCAGVAMRHYMELVKRDAMRERERAEARPADAPKGLSALFVLLCCPHFELLDRCMLGTARALSARAPAVARLAWALLLLAPFLFAARMLYVSAEQPLLAAVLTAASGAAVLAVDQVSASTRAAQQCAAGAAPKQPSQRQQGKATCYTQTHAMSLFTPPASTEWGRA